MIAYSNKILKEMFDGARVSCQLPYNTIANNRDVAELVEQGNGRISLSGQQSKYAMVVSDGKIRFVTAGERGRYILKPAPTASFIFYKEFCPANEHLSMQIASQVYNIDVAKNCLCFFGDGTPAYLTKRFDVKQDGSKLRMEDFASLAGLSQENAGSDFKYNRLSYEECGSLIDRFAYAPMVEKLKFFDIVVFNYLICNDDAHLKNFSLIENKHGDMVLSPAYDLMNTAMHLPNPTIFALEKGLFKEGMPKGDVYGISKGSFIQFGSRLGLPERAVNREIDKFTADYALIEALVSDSLLSDGLKDSFLSSLKYRRTTIRK